VALRREKGSLAPRLGRPETTRAGQTGAQTRPKGGERRETKNRGGEDKRGRKKGHSASRVASPLSTRVVMERGS